MANSGPWEVLILVLILIIVLVSLIRLAFKGGKAGTALKIILGLFFIITAIGANVFASGLWTEGQKTWLIHSTTEGQQMMAAANGIRYGGIALGLFGLILLAIPLFQSVSNANNAAQALPKQDPRGLADPMKGCSRCGAMNLQEARFCSKCGANLYSNSPIQPANPSYCPRCGKGIAERTVFCPECGEKVGRGV